MYPELNQSNLNWAVKKYKKLLFDNTCWHQITVSNVWGLDRDVVLKTIMKSCKPAHFIPVHYQSFNNTATFLLKNCSEAIKKLCSRNLLISNSYDKHNPLKISIRLCYAEGNDFNIDIRQNLINVLNKRFNKETGILNLENFANDPELQEYCALCQPKLFFYVLDLVKCFPFNILILKNNDIGCLSPMEALQEIKKSIALDLRNNCIEKISELDYLRHLNVTDLWLDGNPVCNKYNIITFNKNIKDHVRNLERLDGIQIKSFYEEYSGKPNINMPVTNNLRPSDSNLKGKIDSCEPVPSTKLTKAGKKRCKEYLLQGYSIKEAIALAKNPGNPGLNKDFKRCSTDNVVPPSGAKKAKIKENTYSSTITSGQFQENVRVAILAKSYPEVLLTADQLTGIQSNILEQIVLHKDKAIKPKFLDVTHKQGLLVINCANKDTATWLKSKINELESWEGISLMAVNNSKIPRPLILEGLFPNSAQEKTDKIIDFLDAQNESLKVSEWKILSRTVDGNCAKLTFAVDRCWLTNLKKENFIVSYKFGQVNLRTKPYVSVSTFVTGELVPEEEKNVGCSNSSTVTIDPVVPAIVVEPSTSKDITNDECDQNQDTQIKTEMDDDMAQEEANTNEYDQNQNTGIDAQMDNEEVQKGKNTTYCTNSTIAIDAIVPATIMESASCNKINGNECLQSQDIGIKVQMCDDGIQEEANTNECDESQNRAVKTQVNNKGVSCCSNSIEDAVVLTTMVEPFTSKENNDSECGQSQNMGINDVVEEEANTNKFEQSEEEEIVIHMHNTEEFDKGQVGGIDTQIDKEEVQGEVNANEYDRSQINVIVAQMDDEGIQKETNINKCGQNQLGEIETQIVEECLQKDIKTEKCDEEQNHGIETQMDKDLSQEEANNSSLTEIKTEIEPLVRNEAVVGSTIV